MPSNALQPETCGEKKISQVVRSHVFVNIPHPEFVSNRLLIGLHIWIIRSFKRWLFDLCKRDIYARLSRPNSIDGGIKNRNQFIPTSWFRSGTGSPLLDFRHFNEEAIENNGQQDSIASVLCCKGDFFVAGFLSKVVEDLSLLQDEKRLREALSFANTRGAVNVTKRGAISALPTKEAVTDAFLNTVLKYNAIFCIMINFVGKKRQSYPPKPDAMVNENCMDIFGTTADVQT
ncbi:unnamed protein product [Lactuca virosa]|uniref:Carbohydrate kinase PfkB domain-containing protein n=1 Tax=Lactuca virosa TaxID=75947 RepID=A0AAU9N0R2_9ASTR|nr:unnamed protein product [Lactuca virosa]